MRKVATPFGVSTPAQAAAIAALQPAGLIRAEPRGRHSRYRAEVEAVRGLVAYLTDTCCGGPVTVTFTLLVRSPSDEPPCPSPPGPSLMAATLREVGRVSFKAAPAPPPGPPCAHRGAALPAGRVAALKLSTLRTWYACDKPGFERLGLPVSPCQTCGVPDGQKCSAACPGYEPGEPD